MPCAGERVLPRRLPVAPGLVAPAVPPALIDPAPLRSARMCDFPSVHRSRTPCYRKRTKGEVQRSGESLRISTAIRMGGTMAASTQGLARRPHSTLDTVQEALTALAARYRGDEVLTSIKHIPAREAQFRPMPAWVRPELAAAYRAKGIDRLYSHQAAAAELARAGKDFVVVTPTASGKTLCYNLPVLNAILENTDTRALYLFPTKALAQDQLAELHDLATRARRSLRRFHLRRRHAQRRAQSHSRARPRDPHESRHAAHRHPAAPHQVDARVRKSALHRARRAAHLSRRFRQPSGQRAAPHRAHRAILRLAPAIHLLLGHDCESRRACRRN